MTWIKSWAAATALALGMHSLCSAAGYTITNLGSLGGTRSYGYAVNSAGNAAVIAWTAGDTDFRAALYGGTLHDLGALGGTRSQAFDINDSGRVVGTAYTAGNSVYRAFLYDGTMHDLFGAAGGPQSEANGINASGQIAATVNNQAVLYDGTMHPLGTLGGSGGAALGLNNSGEVTGYSSISGNGAIHAFLHDGATVHDLGTLGGTNSVGYRVNASGQVAGWSNTPSGDQHAFLYDGTMHDLGTFGGTISTGYAISASGQVLGGAFSAGNATYHAFIYDVVHGMSDLNTMINPAPGWELQEARGVNSAGQIIGVGTLNGQVRAFLLTPVPEPSSLALAAAALASVALFRLKARRSP